VKQSTPIAVGEKKKASLLLCGWNLQSKFQKDTLNFEIWRSDPMFTKKEFGASSLVHSRKNSAKLDVFLE
jgi:hypothetical protein